MLPDGAKQRLLETLRSARDRLVVTWLSDGGPRIGELCGLHLVDLHLRADLGVVRPHAFRHWFTSAVLDACGGNLVVARDAGGWASATVVDEVYVPSQIRCRRRTAAPVGWALCRRR